MPRVEYDRHHVLFDRLSWTTRPQARMLRSYPMLIPALDRDVHEALHKECPPVPVLGYYALSQAQREFSCKGNTIDSMDALMQTIDRISQNPRNHEIDRQLCQLAIHAIDLQKVFVHEGQYRAIA